MQPLWVLIATLGFSGGLERPGVEFRVFQFPPDKIPRIDGEKDDWSIVPDSYAIGIDQMRETVVGLGDKRDLADLDVKVKVGWVKGQNHLYFLYEASDDYWDFARPDLHNDIFELVIDGDLSGGPFIRQMHPIEKLRDRLETHALFHGVHAQNYHIFTPAEGKDWAMVWGSQPWIKDLPFANAVCKYNFKPGQKGKLVLEFFVTPFDYAPPDPARAVPVEAYRRQDHRYVLGRSRLRQRKSRAIRGLLEPLPQDHHVRQRLGSGRVPSHATGGRLAKASVRGLVLPGDRWCGTKGGVSGSFARRYQIVAMGFRRRPDLHRASPHSPVQVGRRVYRRPRC